MASLNGVLETILPDGWYRDASYKVSGAVLRGVKAGLAVTAGILLAAATAGTLLPAQTAPYVVALVTLTLQAVDKFIREWKVEGEDGGNPPPLTDEVPAEPEPLPPILIPEPTPEPEPEPEPLPEEPEEPAIEPEEPVVPPEDTEIPGAEELPEGGTELPELPEIPEGEEVIPLPEEPVDTTGETGKLM